MFTLSAADRAVAFVNPTGIASNELSITRGKILIGYQLTVRLFLSGLPCVIVETRQLSRIMNNSSERRGVRERAVAAGRNQTASIVSCFQFWDWIESDRVG